MSTQIDCSLFEDVADVIGLGNPAIVEKDYYVVQLLKLVSELQCDYHELVFTGGTALAKSAIKTYRMSEDIDIKLVPNKAFDELMSGNAKRNARKSVKQQIEAVISSSRLFSFEEKGDVNDEYRYFSFDIRYPQVYQQAPCLRPFIKLEFIESALLDEAKSKSIQSIFSNVLKTDVEVEGLLCASIMETQAEKLVSMMRRTSSVYRDQTREDDKTLIRHIYDTYHIQQAKTADIEFLGTLVANAIAIDVKRYGNQHSEMVASPIDELRFGLRRLTTETKYQERYKSYVGPMVYATKPVRWDDALIVFTELANEVLNYLERKGIAT